MVRIALVLGDITTQSVDAIVNAANTSLHAGGGDGHRRDLVVGMAREVPRRRLQDAVPPVGDDVG